MLKHTGKHKVRPTQVKKKDREEKKEFYPDSNNFGFTYDGVSNVDSYQRHT